MPMRPRPQSSAPRLKRSTMPPSKSAKEERHSSSSSDRNAPSAQCWQIHAVNTQWPQRTDCREPLSDGRSAPWIRDMGLSAGIASASLLSLLQDC